MIEKNMDYGIYKDSLKIAGDIITDAFGDAINDSKWINKVY